MLTIVCRLVLDRGTVNIMSVSIVIILISPLERLWRGRRVASLHGSLYGLGIISWNMVCSPGYLQPSSQRGGHSVCGPPPRRPRPLPCRWPKHLNPVLMILSSRRSTLACCGLHQVMFTLSWIYCFLVGFFYHSCIRISFVNFKSFDGLLEFESSCNNITYYLLMTSLFRNLKLESFTIELFSFADMK